MSAWGQLSGAISDYMNGTPTGPDAVVLIVVVCLPVIGLGIWLVRAQRRQQEARRTFALESGFTYEPKLIRLDDKTSPFNRKAQKELQLFQGGTFQFLRNVMRGGTTDAEVVLCDYGYTSGKTGWWQTVAAFPRAGRDLPHFEVRPERWAQKIGQRLGMQDIDFESHPQFSKEWLLSGQDEAAVRGLFSPDLLSFFEAVDTRQRWWVEGKGKWLLVWRDNKIIKSAELRMFLEQASAIGRNFKDRAQVGAGS